MMGWRSLLFVAASDQVRIAKIGTRGAHAVILDLEDAVSAEDKPQARAGLGDVIEQLSAIVPVIVRVNAGWLDAIADFTVAVRPGVSAIMVPKVEDAGRLKALVEIVAELAARQGLTYVPPIMALIESAAGLAVLDAIADTPQVAALALGTEDFALSMGVEPSPELLALPCRQIALAAARRGLSSFAIPASIGIIQDEAAWRSAITEARAVGVTGALCIHPAQVRIANAVYDEDFARAASASDLLAAWRRAGEPAVFEYSGKMIDRPVLLAAMRLLEHRGPSHEKRT